MKRITLLLGLLISIGFSASAAKEIIRHRIEPKETLFRIALMYNSTVNDIVKANPGMNPKSISSGTVIKVPKDTKIRDAEFVESFLNGKPEFPPISQVATLITREKPFENHIANNTTSARSSQPRKEDDNPFLTPAEPRTGPASDEQPVKEQLTSEPDRADKNQGIEDENPFMSPKQKASDTKAPVKAAAKSNAAETITSTNE